jgi:hypothetical protein
MRCTGRVSMWGDEMEKTNAYLAGSQEYAPAALSADSRSRTAISYMDGVEWQHHVEHDADGVHLYPSVESVLSNNPCAHQCGIVRLQITEIGWPVAQNFDRAASSGVSESAAECSEQPTKDVAEAPEPNQPEQHQPEQQAEGRS